MQLLEILDLTGPAEKPDQPCPVELEYNGAILPDDVSWSVLWAALASLPGFLDDIPQDKCTQADLMESVKQGNTLVSAEIISQEQLFAEIESALVALRDWCEDEQNKIWDETIA